LVEEKSLGDPLLLVALVRDAKLTGPWLKAAKKGKSVEYKAPPDGSGGLASWVLAEAKKRGVVMTDPVAEYMVAVAGKDLRLLVRELEKLRLYMHGRVDATREDIDAVVTPHMETHAWDLCECVLQKDRRRALHLFSSLYREQGESCLMPVLYALMKQTERLLVADQMISAGATSEEIAQAIAMHPWRCKNHFIPHVKKHSAPMIREGMRHLCELDVTLKSTTASKRTHAELALCFLTN
jgi:DNA polymerase-3 subunit delta